MRVYLTPYVGDGTAENPKRGKYCNVGKFKGRSFPGIMKRWSAMPFGVTQVCLVSAYVTPEEHEQLMQNSDVFAFPEDLDSELNNTLALEQALIYFGIPHEWLSKGMRYREILRRISGMFQMMQNMNGQKKRFAHLDTPFGMDTKAEHFKHGQMMGTVRQTLHKVGEEYQATKFNLKQEI